MDSDKSINEKNGGIKLNFWEDLPVEGPRREVASTKYKNGGQNGTRVSLAAVDESSKSRQAPTNQ